MVNINMCRNFRVKPNDMCFHVILVLISVLCRIYTVDGLLSEYGQRDIVSSGDYVGVCNKDNYKNTQSCCEDNEFHCIVDCITFDKVCDSNSSFDNVDCIDASDEFGCSLQTCVTRTPKCEQICIDLPDNKSKCSCYKGYELYTITDSTTCDDVNECKFGIHSCSHDCVNLNGTFECTCRDGFQKDSNRSSNNCYVDDKTTFVMFYESDWIYYYDLITGYSYPLVHSGKVESMDYDPHTDILYWSNSTNVARSYIPGAKNGTVTNGHAQVLREPEFPEDKERESIAIDWASGNLYWLSPDPLDYFFSRIMVSKLDGRYVKTILEIPRANSLVVDSEYPIMYWLSGGDEPQIGSVQLDGMSISAVRYLPKQNPVALALDHLSDGRLYWVDSLSHTIYFAFKVGSRVRKIYTTTPEQSPISLDVFENNLYWATKESGEILTVDKFGRNEVKQLLGFMDKDSVVKVYHKRKVNKNLKPGGVFCSDQCSHLCLRSPSGFTCRCPDGDGIMTTGGGFDCLDEKEEPMEDPLDCNCLKKELVYNPDSPYSQCACGDFYGNYNPHDYDQFKMMFSNLTPIVGRIVLVITVLVIIVIIVIAVVFYKRNNSPHGSDSLVQTMSSVQVNG